MTMAAFRKTVADTAHFCQWAAAAPPGDFVVYHIGNLGRDRIGNAALHDLADTVLLLSEAGFVLGAQYPIHLAGIAGASYAATRTGRGWAPQSILHRRITAQTWRALNSVHHRDSWMSAQRAIRDTLSCSDSLAADTLSALYAEGWVTDAPGKGWCLSPAGLRMLM